MNIPTPPRGAVHGAFGSQTTQGKAMAMDQMTIAEQKFWRREEITICMVVKQGCCEGIVWEGLFYPDDRFEGLEGQRAYVIKSEDGEHAYMFTEAGKFATGYRIGAGSEFEF